MSTGKAWEAVLEHWCREHHRAGRLTWQRNHPPVRLVSRIGPGGEFRARFDGRGPCDFSGELSPHGRGWAADAKDCAASRWPLRALEEHQAARLDGCHRVGGLAFVALRLDGEGWVLPWSELGPRWVAVARGDAERGEASFRRDDGWGLRMPELGDWLTTLEGA